MSRIDSLDVLSLRARLVLAMSPTAPDGSLYLHCLGACFLACSNVREEAALQGLFYTQAAAEDVDGDDTITRLAMVGVRP